MYQVYTLTDPRDTSIRYVGMSKDAKKRLFMHMATAKRRETNKDMWLLDLRFAGIKPILNIIETLETLQQAEDRERYWIQHYFSMGTPLTNMTGNAPKKSKPNKEEQQQAITYQTESIVVSKSTDPIGLLLIEDVAKFLKLKEETVTKLIRQKKLPGFKVTAGSWRVKDSDLRAYIEEQRRKYQQEK